MAKDTHDLSEPGARLRAHLHAHVADHAYLRLFWSNLAEIAPGVWRSNQPGPRRVAQFAKMGIKTIVNLRGEGSRGTYLLEKAEAEKFGIQMITHSIAARKLRPAETFLALLDTFETVKRPFVMHCKSGADRAGLASALWLLHMEGQSPAEAKRMLSFRYIHVKASHTGILDLLLETYETDCMHEMIPIRTWFETRYDPEDLTARFAARRRGRKGRDGT